MRLERIDLFLALLMLVPEAEQEVLVELLGCLLSLSVDIELILKLGRADWCLIEYVQVLQVEVLLFILAITFRFRLC